MMGLLVPMWLLPADDARHGPVLRVVGMPAEGVVHVADLSFDSVSSAEELYGPLTRAMNEGRLTVTVLEGVMV